MSMGPIEKLIFFSMAMLTIPVGSFFASKSFVFEGKSEIPSPSASGPILFDGWVPHFCKQVLHVGQC